MNTINVLVTYSNSLLDLKCKLCVYRLKICQLECYVDKLVIVAVKYQ